jgi:hypothetical protein
MAQSYWTSRCVWRDGPHVHPSKLVPGYITDYTRADSRDRAKEIVKAKYPTAKFYR